MVDSEAKGGKMEAEERRGGEEEMSLLERVRKNQKTGRKVKNQRIGK
jgi:hypothetical protein